MGIKLAAFAGLLGRTGGNTMRARDIILASTFLCLGTSLFANGDSNEPADDVAQSASKNSVTSLDDLPRKVYPIDKLASELIVSDEFEALVAQVHADVSELLDKYDIQDKATLQNLYRILSQTAFFDGDYDSAIHLSLIHI